MGQPVVHFEVIGKGRAQAAELLLGALRLGDRLQQPDELRARDPRGQPGPDGTGIGGAIAPGPDGYEGHVTFCVAVDDCEAALAKAESLGGTRVFGPETIMARAALSCLLSRRRRRAARRRTRRSSAAARRAARPSAPSRAVPWPGRCRAGGPAGRRSGSASKTISEREPDDLDHGLGQLQQRVLVRVADVDRQVLVGLGQRDQAADQVVDVTEGAGLAAVAEDGQRLVLERLAQEGRDRAAVVGPHPRSRRC